MSTPAVDTGVRVGAGARHRARVVAALSSGIAQVAMVVGLLPWLIAPGVIQPDTKIDLVVSPWRYLGRSLDAWSTHSGFGELQNQAYGYLFPMGPFFGVLHSLGVPGWAAQRAWWSVLLVVGYLGATLFARRVMGLSTPAAVVTGLAFALSPRVLTLLSELSAETWPGMLMPWMLLAVHRLRAAEPAGGRSVRRTVAVIGLLTAALGGVNATASLVPVLATLVYALVVVRPRRRVLAVLLGIALGSVWWLGPLVVLGGYAYPFMDFIETSRITTAVTTLPGILRGASDWVAYIIDADGHPVWQSGWVVAQGLLSILATTTLAGIGLSGLALRARQTCRRDTTALALLLGLGVLGMAAGYAGAAHGPQADAVRALLDGPLAAARNVHKLDPLVRLPLAVGVGTAFGWLLDRVRRAGSDNPSRGVALAGVTGVALVLLGTLSPLLSGRLADASGVASWPEAVPAAARDIDARAARDGGSTLVLPSARSAEFTWGTTADEPLSAFAASPIAVRASAPLFHAGAQRIVDRIDAAVASSHDVRAALEAARRAGVRRVAVRWGLSDAQRAGSAQADVTALVTSGATTNHRQFGEADARYDVFDLAGPTDANSVSTVGVPVGVLGGPESTLTLAALGLDPSRAFVMGRPGGWITDDVRLRTYANGKPASAAFGPTLMADDPAPQRLGARDLDFPGRTSSLASIRLRGASDVSAEHSTSDPFGDLLLGPGTSPFAAFDASPTTRWLTPLDERSPLVIRWDAGAKAQRMTLTGASAGGARMSGVTARADGHELTVGVSHGRWTVDVPAGVHELSLMPRGSGSAQGAGGAIGFSSVTSSAPVDAVVMLPGVASPSRSGVVMSRTHPWANGRPLSSEDDGLMTRAVRFSAPGTMRVELTSTVASRAEGQAVDLWMRRDGGAWQPVTGARTGGDAAAISVPSGTVEFKASPEVERIVLTPQSADARASLGLSSPSHGTVGTPPSEVVTSATTQGANPGWATSGGPGAMVPLDGWRQGVMGGEPGGRVHFAPQRAHVAALGGGMACVLLLLVLAATSRPRSRDRGTDPGTSSAARSSLAARDGDDLLQRSTSTGPSATHGHRPTVLLTLAAVFGLGVVVIGPWAVPVTVAAVLVPRRLRLTVMLAAMVLVGPIMASLGVVDRGSAGALIGQLLTAFALALFALDLLRADLRRLDPLRRGGPGAHGAARAARRGAS